MADKTINDYTAAVSIDASNDYYLIEQSGVYKKINRNVGLGLASAPLGTTDVQSPQNKTFDNTNSITIKDGSLTIQNSSSTTKQAVFSASSITAGQTRTFTFPDLSGTLVTTSGSQTLTNKTITSPTISGGSIDNSTITVDSISGHTSGTLVTVANLQISNGVLNSANAVTATSIADGAIQPKALISGTGSGWSWSSWTPTFTNVTLGNGTINFAKYIQIGKTVFFRIKVTVGTTSTVTGAIQFSPPVTANTDYSGAVDQFWVQGMFTQPGTINALAIGWFIDATHLQLRPIITDTSYAKATTDTSSSVPFSWGNGNFFQATGFYEAA